MRQVLSSLKTAISNECKTELVREVLGNKKGTVGNLADVKGWSMHGAFAQLSGLPRQAITRLKDCLRDKGEAVAPFNESMASRHSQMWSND